MNFNELKKSDKEYDIKDLNNSDGSPFMVDRYIDLKNNRFYEYNKKTNVYREIFDLGTEKNPTDWIKNTYTK